MKQQAKSICDIINDINSKEEIKTLIFVGGYCSNQILTKLIKDGLNKITTYLLPSNPSLAIMEGAVLFGIEPKSINMRKAKYTIGMELNVPWDDKIHSEKGTKFYDEERQNWYCKKCFVKFIEINQNLKYGEKISQFSTPQDKEQTFVISQFYKTKKPNPVFIFEEGIIKIGEFELEFGNLYDKLEDREIETIMKFGGTFIEVTAVHIKSGKSVKTTLIFD